MTQSSHEPLDQLDALERAIADARENILKQAAAELAILSADLFVVPTEGLPLPGPDQGGDVPLNLSGVVLHDGTHAVAAFSRPEHAIPVFGAPATHKLRGQHLLEAFSAATVVLNPGREQGLVLSSVDMAGILQNAGVAAPLTDGSELELTVPDPHPTLLVQSLTARLTGNGIHAAWLARATNVHTGETGWRLEVHGDASLQDVRNRVYAAIDGVNFKGETLDMVYAEGGAEAPGLRLI